MARASEGLAPGVGGPTPALLGRQAECAVLDALMADVRAGTSRALVLRGEAGMGKSALLDHLVRSAVGCRVTSVVAVQSEAELAYAAVHQLAHPLLEHLEGLPEPQLAALATALGRRAGSAPDPFLVGLALLSLLAAAAADRPVVWVVDDAQWLDRASAQVLAFVARRLGAESAVCVFAVREQEDGFTVADRAAPHELDGLPELRITGIGDEDALALLESAVHGPLDPRVRDQIVAESRGNPLALLELPSGLTHAALAGGYGIPHMGGLSRRLEDGFMRRWEELPAATRQLVLLAAAEPTGDAVLVWRAAAVQGLDATSATAAPAASLVELGARVRFRHPLVRSAVYRGATPQARMAAHAALARCTDADVQPERRAWHRALATAVPDEEVAAELERSAERARARGGLAAGAAFLQRAVELTPEPGCRAVRALAAAHAAQEAGSLEAAHDLLVVAESGPLDEVQRAHAALRRAELAFTRQPGGSVPALLLAAGKGLERLDLPLARTAYLQAISAAMFAGSLASGECLRDVADVICATPQPAGPPRAVDLLLNAFARMVRDDASAAPDMQRALSAFALPDVTTEEELRWSWLAFVGAAGLWDDVSARRLADRQVDLARRTGALSVLPSALSGRVVTHLFDGELAEAASLCAEVDTIVAVTGTRVTNYGAVALAAWRGRADEAERIGQDAARLATERGEGVGLTVVAWAGAVLHNGLGRYDRALAAARLASSAPPAPGAARQWAPAELVEAAVRAGEPDLAREALAQLLATTERSGTHWARGIAARCRALLAEGSAADDLYLEAVDELGQTRLRSELARAHLLHGEWLRRDRSRSRAREHLRRAHEMFVEAGMEAFADRAARELRATGVTARKRTIAPTGDLTPRELQIAQLAIEGLTNPEIGSRLFMSPRTVEYHLAKVFVKRGVSSRTGLGVALGDDPGRASVG